MKRNMIIDFPRTSLRGVSVADHDIEMFTID